MAGVAEILSRKGDQVLQLNSLDHFGFGRHYGNTLYFDDPELLIEHAKNIMHLFDKIVVHDFNEVLSDFPKRKTFIYFHGSKLRSLTIDLRNKVREECCGVFLSTPNLLPYIPEGQVIPQPVDFELFRELNLDRDKEYYSISRGYQGEYIKNEILKTYPKCHVVDRSRNHIAYRAMPYLLNEVENYVDMKFDYSKPNPIPLYDPSITAFQAMLCGCKVWGHDYKLLSKSLLKDHDSRNIIEDFHRCLEV